MTYNLLDIIDWMLDRIMPITFKGKSKWVAKPGYITAYNGNFPNSIVYNGSCESAFNNDSMEGPSVSNYTA